MSNTDFGNAPGDLAQDGARPVASDFGQPAAEGSASPPLAPWDSMAGPPPPLPPTRRSFWSRPWVLVLVVVGAVIGAAVVAVAVIIGLFVAQDPNDQVIDRDFATEGDVPMIVEEGLSWDQSGGTLNLYPTDTMAQRLNFAIPTSSAAKVVATVTQPAYADTSALLLWGVQVQNLDRNTGVALLCFPGQAPQLVDLSSGERIGFGGGGGTCEETMQMTLKVQGTVITFNTDTGGSLVYTGKVDYGDLDQVGVVIGADEPDQVLRVSTIEGYVP